MSAPAISPRRIDSLRVDRRIGARQIFGAHSADAVRTASHFTRGLFAHQTKFVGVLKSAGLQPSRQFNPRDIDAAGLNAGDELRRFRQRSRRGFRSRGGRPDARLRLGSLAR